MTQLAIKNMVCPRCVAAVKGVIEELGLGSREVSIGNATVSQDLSPEQRETLDSHLRAIGFELLLNEEDALVERIKTATIFLARRDDGAPVKLSDELSKALGADFKQLSNIFSQHERRTIEKFFIAQKVEHVKELLDYGELTVSEIAYRTGYSSVAHLSRQFKQVAGLTPTQYRLQPSHRQSLDKI